MMHKAVSRQVLGLPLCLLSLLLSYSSCLLFIIVSPSCLSSLVLTSLSPSLVLNTNILILNCAGPLNSPEAMHIHTAARQPLNHLPSAIHASNLTALRGFIYQPVHQNGLHLKNLATKVVLWQLHHKLYFSK